jgi:branched-chain amino acid aminotransferase
LITLADELGLRPERRQIPVDEIFQFSEAGCCGTAAVITPVGSITWRDRKAVYGDGNTPGEFSTKMYKQLRAIQLGEVPDTHDWLTIVPQGAMEGDLDFVTAVGTDPVSC